MKRSTNTSSEGVNSQDIGGSTECTSRNSSRNQKKKKTIKSKPEERVAEAIKELGQNIFLHSSERKRQKQENYITAMQTIEGYIHRIIEYTSDLSSLFINGTESTLLPLIKLVLSARDLSSVTTQE